VSGDHISGWTIATLHAHIQMQIDLLVKANAERNELAREAIAKADAATEKRFDAVNEFRAQLADQARTFLPRGEYDVNHEALAERITQLNERLSALELRLTSRLDVAGGAIAGSSRERTERRLDAGQLIAYGLLAVAVLTLILLYATKK
jgi:hypothetical protein